MNNIATLELRIHGGIHDGAYEPLPDRDTCTIGADAGCDFVLADAGIAPMHLRLARDGAGGWTQQAHDAALPQPLMPGQLLPLGPLAVSVAEAGSPWPAEQAAAMVLSVPADRPTETVVEEASQAALPEPLEQEAQAQPTAAPASRPRLSLATKLAGALLLCLALLVGAALWWLARPQAVAASAAGTVSLDVAAQRAAIAQILHRLKLEGRVTLAAAPSGGWSVQAVALEDDTLEALALALSQLDPKPGLSVTSGEDVRSLVQEALMRLSGNGDAELKAVHLGDGRIRIEGGMADGVVRAELLRQLRAGLPAWLMLESGILIPEERALRLLAALQTQGLGVIQGQWSASQARLEIVARMTPDGIPRWERALLQAVQRHPGVPLHARLERLPPNSMARLPFRVLTVVGGADAYVVLDDGSKLLVQGRRSGWQLVAVQPHEAVFENSRALRVSIPR